MARQVLPIVGAIVGAYFGAPQLGYAIGSIIGNAVDPQIIKGPKLGEAGLQTSAEGIYRPIVFGTGAVKGNIICRGNRQVKKKRDRQGKGGPVTESERVYWTFAIRICEARDSAGGISLLRIWEDEKLVFDVTPDSEIVEETIEFAQRFRYYNGSDDQLPDPDLEAFLGAGNVPAYPGTTYIVFPNYDLTDTGERVKDYRFEVSSHASTSPPVEVLAMRSSDPSAPFLSIQLPSPDGIDWSASWETATNSHNSHLIATPERYISYAAGDIPAYLEPGDTSWTAGTGTALSGVGSSNVGSVDATGQKILIANGAGQRPLRSLDGGKTWEHAGGIFSCDAMVFTAGGWNCTYLNKIYWSIDDGDNFTEVETMTPFSSPRCSWSGAYRSMFGGGGSTPLEPEIWETSTGLSWASPSLPFSGTATQVISIVSGVATGDTDETWVCMADNGEIAWRDPETGMWALAANTMGCKPYGLTFNGAVFIAIGGQGLTDANGFIKTSPDGNIWTISKTGSLASSENWWTIAALKISAGVAAGEKVPLSDIVGALCSRPGLPASSYSVIELTDMVDGLVLADDYTYADAIRTLMPLYFFGASEHDAGSGYKLHFPMHGKAVVSTLTIDDFVDVPDRSVRQDAFERPRVLHLHYQSPTVGYAPAKASPTRFSPDVKVVGEQSIQVPVSFGDQSEIWKRADKILKIIWTGIAGEEEFTLPMSFLYLVPTDAIGVSLRGQVRRMVISDQSYEAGIIKCKLVSDRQGNYTSNLTGIPLPEPTPPPPSIVGPTIMAFGDWPALTDNNDRLLYYIGATGQTEAWHGAQIDRSTDGGANFEVASTFSQNTIMGILQNEVTAASRYFTDTTNVIRVSLYLEDEIESLTNVQFNSEGGAFMLSYQEGGVTKWEMQQYRDAEQDMDGDWLLTTLKRGQLNTEPAAHAPGDIFVMLDGVQSVDAVTAWLNTDLTHRATSVGRSPDGVPTQTDEFTGASQREFPVASFSAERVGDTITGTIIARHRFGTEVNPIRSVNWAGYEITASAGGQTETIISMTDDFSIDVGGFSSPVLLTISQVNRFPISGPPVSESIP